MNLKELYKSANNKISINPELIEKSINKVNRQSKGLFSTHRFYLKAAVSACVVVILFFTSVGFFELIKSHMAENKPAATIDNTVTNKLSDDKRFIYLPPTIFSREGDQVNFITSPQYQYYRYNGNYYKVAGIDTRIQNNISRQLCNGLYEIKGIDTSENIAQYYNPYFYRLDYASKDTITFQGKPYVFNRNKEVAAGKFLGIGDLIVNKDGVTGQFEIYEMPGYDASKGVTVKIKDTYYPAYQYTSTVTFNGLTYQLEDHPLNYGSASSDEEYIGMADKYKAYKYDSTDIKRSIMIHINDSQEVIANVIPYPLDMPIPKSKYDTGQKAMYPSLARVQWEGHGFYMTEFNPEDSDSLKERLGKYLGSDTYDGYTYEFYEIKGMSPDKSIIVKNNQEYEKYNFLCPDTIIYNGHHYKWGLPDSYVKGKQIGMAGPYKVYEFQGADPDKIIDVMDDQTPYRGFEVDLTFYRADN